MNKSRAMIVPLHLQGADNGKAFKRIFNASCFFVVVDLVRSFFFMFDFYFNACMFGRMDCWRMCVRV